YPRRLILEDARRRGIEILPLDVNRSEHDYAVESLPGPPASSAIEERAAPGYGIRLALKDVHGISDVEIRSILQARADRAFRDVGDFIRRTNVSRPVVEALAHAGAFDALPGGSRRDRLYEAMTARPQREGDQLALDLSAYVPGDGRGMSEGVGGEAGDLTEAHPRAFTFPEHTDTEKVRAELEVLGLDASRHL